MRVEAGRTVVGVSLRRARTSTAGWPQMIRAGKGRCYHAAAVMLRRGDDAMRATSGDQMGYEGQLLLLQAATAVLRGVTGRAASGNGWAATVDR